MFAVFLPFGRLIGTAFSLSNVFNFQCYIYRVNAVGGTLARDDSPLKLAPSLVFTLSMIEDNKNAKNERSLNIEHECPISRPTFVVQLHLLSIMRVRQAIRQEVGWISLSRIDQLVAELTLIVVQPAQ